jgi:cytochrome c
MRRKIAGLTIAAALAAITSPALADGDVAHGEEVFRRCAACHGIGDGSRPIGPSLNGVVGRTAGTEEAFEAKYSPAMKEAGGGGLVWTEDEIDAYLADPRKKVPGNRMAFVGLKDETDRADVIAYLKTFSPGTQ